MSTFELLRNVFALVAGVGFLLVALGGIAFWLFRLFSEKWLTAKFDERLESYKHAQQKELEKLRFTINSLMDRKTKLHQHEFEVLPQVWSLLCDAYSEAAQFTSPLQTYPDLNRMTSAHLAEFLEKSPLEGWQKAELSDHGDKTAQYMKQIFWHDLRRVRKSYAAFHAYLIKSGIFIQPILKGQLKLLSDMIYDAIWEKQFEEENPVPRVGRYEKGERLRGEGPKIFANIESELSQRLWNVELQD